MAKVLLAALVIFVVLSVRVLVERLYAAFAVRHPELGPFRSSDGRCACGSGTCERR